VDNESSKLVQNSRELLEAIEKLNKPPEPEPQLPAYVEPTSLEFPEFKFWPTRMETFKKNSLGFIESFYEQYARLPTQRDFRKNFPKEKLPNKKEEWEEFIVDIQEPLIARGIRPYELPYIFYEAQFVLAVNLICDPHDKRAVPAKLKEAGLTTKQWKNFLRDEHYLTYYKEAVDRIFDKQTQITAKLNLTKLVENGDLQAIKYYEERQNIYRPQKENDYQALLLTMLTSMMEILAKHVSPDVLHQVAIEFQERDIIDVSSTAALPVGN
jgi:hypothetical protein